VGPLVLTAAPGAQAAAPNRAAFITGKKIGHAVERNRAKRWLREAFRLQLPYIKAGWDIILIARPSIGGSDFRRVEAALAESLKRARLYEDHRPLGHPPVSKDD